MLDVVSSRFLRHAPCPKCGSRDNLAIYSSGSAYCFGCSFFTRLPEERLAHVTNKVLENVRSNVRSYPDDVISYYPGRVVEWIAKYHLTPIDLINNDVFWSPKREQLIYTFYGDDSSGNVVLWQARNFREGTTHKHRFFTGGSPEDVIAKYSQGEGRNTCVIVEDCISGIKVSYAGADGVPCFGSSVSRQKLSRLAKFYDTMFVWLDDDKYNNAQRIALQGASLGMTTRVIHTERDPKEYEVKFIKGIFNL